MRAGVKVSGCEHDWGRRTVQSRSALPRGGRCKAVDVGIIRARVLIEIVFILEAGGLNGMLFATRE